MFPFAAFPAAKNRARVVDEAALGAVHRSVHDAGDACPVRVPVLVCST